jgi:hypothetical protein
VKSLAFVVWGGGGMEGYEPEGIFSSSGAAGGPTSASRPFLEGLDAVAVEVSGDGAGVAWGECAEGEVGDGVCCSIAVSGTV